jgi:tetratricopeptide (TPR) repeat protein
MDSKSKGILHRFRLHPDKWFLPLLLLTALGLRLHNLGQESLWLDEIGQVLYAQNFWWQTVLQSAQHVGNTPLSYLITHFTLHIGQSEGVLRLPALIWGVLSVFMVWRLGKLWFGKPIGYLAAFLLTFTPLHVYYSQEVRFYSLATFLTLLSLYTLSQAVDKNTQRSWLLFGVFHLLALYSHYYVLGVTAMQALWLQWTVHIRRCQRSRLISFLFAAGLAVLLFVPWVYYDNYYIAQGVPNPRSSPRALVLSELAKLPSFVHSSLPEILGSPLLYPGRAISSLRSVEWAWVGLIWSIYLGGVPLLILTYKLFNIDIPDVRGNLALPILISVMGFAVTLLLDYLIPYPFGVRQALIYVPLVLLSVSTVYLTTVRLISQQLLRDRVDEQVVVTIATGALMAFSVLALWSPITDIYYEQQKPHYREMSRYLLRYVQSRDILATDDPRFVWFYAPELRRQTVWLRHGEYDPSLTLSELASQYPKVWVTAKPSFLRSVLQPWIEENDPLDIDFSHDANPSSTKLYLFSKTTDRRELLVHAYSKSSTPKYMHALLDEGFVGAAHDLAMRMLNKDSLTSHEKQRLLIEVANCLMKTGHSDRAVELLESGQAALGDETGAEVWVTLGRAYTSSHHTDEAIVAFERALALNPEHFWAYHLLAKILFSQERWQGVVFLERAAVQYAPRDDLHVASLTWMAGAYSQLGKTSTACEVLGQAYAIQESKELSEEMTKLGCTDEDGP